MESTVPDQARLDFEVTGPDWLGLVIDNRRLFDALQHGWLRPVVPRTSVPVGVNAFVRERDESAGNRIPVRIRLNLAKLPDLEVSAFRHNRWRSMPLSHVAASDTAVCWPGALPAFAIRELAVPSNEYCVRLLNMARRISNVEVPMVEVSHATGCADQETLMLTEPLPQM